jgi:polyisoprenoid-binding protein YceI
MKKFWWILAALVLVAVVAVAAPFLYSAVRGDDAPAASVSTEGAEEASGELDGTWTVVPGEEPNRTAAGYTVDEILRGEPVTVVGSTDQVTGEAALSDSTLERASFEVQVASIATDIGNRDNQFRGPNVLDAAAHPVATLEVTEPVDLASVPGDGSTATVPMTVDLTVKGTTVSKPVEVTVLRSGERLIASGAVPMTWTEVGVTAPDLGFVTVDPTGTIDFLVTLEKA